MIDLSGRHIAVIGGSRGIGAAASRMSAKAGANVSVFYRSQSEAAEKVAGECRAFGKKTFLSRGDAALEGSIESGLDEAVKNLGPLSGMIVSAGIFEPAKIETMTSAFWDNMMAANLRSTFLAVKAAARHLRLANEKAKRKIGGSIVIYTSTAGQRGSDTFSAYAASKAGQIIFMRGMAKELAADNIRVNCVAPSWTETDMSSNTMDAIGREEVLKGCPLGRVGQPDDVAGATVFLLSDLAGFITGSTITVDGGIDMRG